MMTHENNEYYINLSSKGKYISLCQGHPIGAGIFVAITGPPEMKEITEKFINCHFFTNGAERKCVKVLCEYIFYQNL